jgi:hypothetical protein
MTDPRRGGEHRSGGDRARCGREWGHQETFHFCGYVPKKATPRPEGYELPGVVDIAPVSDCIAKGPENWIESWTFNDLGFFDDVDAAESVVPEFDQAQFDVYAHEFLDERFVGGIAEPWSVPPLGCKPSARFGTTPSLDAA